MKLKTVTITYDYVIAVEDDYSEIDVVPVALDFAHEALRDISKYDLDIDIDDYRPSSLSGWDGKCIPYGGDGNTTTEEYLK